MSKFKKRNIFFLTFWLLFLNAVLFAQDAAPEAGEAGQPAQQEAIIPPIEPDDALAPSGLSASSNVTLDFKEADIQNVLKIISYKAGINIVTTPDVIGNITMRLVDVPWETALDVVLKTYGFAYQRQGNIILVTKLENISKIQAEEPLQTEIFTLKFLDAQDAEKIIIPLLSPRGRISVLYARGQKGWKFGTFKIGREQTAAQIEKEKAEEAKEETISLEKDASGEVVSKKATFDPSVKSKTLIISDNAASIDRIRNVIIPLIDKKPQQVLIESKLIEVNRDKLKDLGVDWGIGSIGNATSSTVNTGSFGKNDARNTLYTLGGHSLGSEVKPSVFGAKEGSSLVPGVEPYNIGAEIIFQKLTGTKFEAVLHALEEDVNTNTLSAPRIMTLDNQEASILIGYHTPILTSTVTAGTDTTGPTQTQTLDYYQEIGIRLNVVPQVSEEGYINMIIHPSVTSSSSNITATNVAGTGSAAIQTTVDYPIIDVREAQTQVLMKDGETIVIGGLLKDVKSKETIGIPMLSKIPILGGLFRRDTYDTQKVDLLMFITARIVKEGEFTPQEIARLEQELGKDRVVKAEAVSKSKKKKK